MRGLVDDAGFQEMPDAQCWQAFWPDPSRVLTDCGLVGGMMALEHCAGDGWFTLAMARMARHGSRSTSTIRRGPRPI
jgi:hypothetical protein